MRVLFVGYGSIAKRHINNLRALCSERKIALEVDLLRRVESTPPSGIACVHTFSSLESAATAYDAVFITNPTSLHYQTLLSLIDYAPCFFVEKPVFHEADLDLSPFERDDKLFYVACPLRYTAVLEWVRENIDFARAIGLRCISSSYLPDWRPNQDYRSTYSAHTDLGGGVHIDLIHEWDYVVSFLGWPLRVFSLIAKRSSLEIDSPDVALYLADYGDKTVELHLDYYGRATVRKLEVFTDSDTIVCDLVAGSIDYLVAGRHIDLCEERDNFQKREMSHFLDCVMGKAAPCNTLHEAVRTLALAKGDRDAIGIVHCMR